MIKQTVIETSESTDKTYDAIIIGSGQAGTPLAFRLAGAGWKIALIEREAVGGTCINRGCTPSKSMVASARVAYQAGRAGEFGIKVDSVTADLQSIVTRKNKIVTGFRNHIEVNLKNQANIDLMYGEASFVNKKEVKVVLNDGNTGNYSADHIFINTGARPVIPNISEKKSVPFLDSTTIMELEELPEHLLIIGAGYVALEFGQMFSRFGSKVTMVDRSARFLPNEDADIAQEMRTILESEGIKIITGTIVQSMDISPDGKITVTFIQDGETMELTGSHVLLATGRSPNTETLHLENADIGTDERGYIRVNDRLETNISGIYALGDVKGGPAFTHISYNDYIVVAGNLLENAGTSIANRLVPYCIFTDPELGRVGITEEQARKKGQGYQIARLPMSQVARGTESGETKGLLKALVDPVTKLILGVSVIGPWCGEIMSILQMAMMGGITYVQLREAIFAHPTYAESINNLFSQLDQPQS